MKKLNKYGLLQIIISYLFLWICIIFNNQNKDIFFISYIISILFIVDAKMRYNNLFIKISFWFIVLLFFINFAILVL